MASFFDGYGGCCACTRDKCTYDCATYRSFKPKPITNSMRIRTKTDEELARMLMAIHWDESDVFDDVEILPSNYADWLDWLKQEATP